MNEITFGFVKPDAYEKRDAIMEEFVLPSGLRVVAYKDPYFFTDRLARRHYRDLQSKGFFNELLLFTQYGVVGTAPQKLERNPTALYVLEGENAVGTLISITGSTDPGDARALAKKLGTKSIRSVYGKGMPDNAFHRSDSHRSARREILLHFRKRELPDYILAMLNDEPYI